LQPTALSKKYYFCAVILNASSLSDLPGIAQQIISHAGHARIFLFYGDMGAGKTTLIKSLCDELGSADVITSPTFSIVNEYAGPNKIYHFDFYRLKNQHEALDIGCEEYFYSGNYCFIEWPEKTPDLLPDSYVRVSIAALADNSRRVTIDKI
jgi:tRNA threonylcarbamoyladenosine biosynthesis protein TsaE